MNKTILIFGAGINQIELIREAKKLGVFTVVIDPSEDPLGKMEADIYYKVDGKDFETTREIALKHNVDGIVTGQMEKPMRLMAKLAQELGFIFHSPEVVEKSLNKSLMKLAFQQNHLPCAKGIVLYPDQKFDQEQISELHFPLIVKPVDAFSSRGVLKINNTDDLILQIENAREFSTNGNIIIEEFLGGREFSVESITFKGKTKVIQVTEKFITPYPYTVEMAHLQPARISMSEKNEIELLVKKAIKAIGIDNSASHAEVMLTKNEVFIIEIGARLGGDFISSYLTKSSTGVSMDKASVQVALGKEPDVAQKFNRYSMIKYLELEQGRKCLKKPSINSIATMPGFVFGTWFIKEGDIIPKITDSAKRPACILFQAEFKNELIERVDKAAKKLLNQTILE